MIRIERKKPLAPGRCEGVGVRFEEIEPTADVLVVKEIVSSVSGEKVELQRAWVECPECSHRMMTDFGRKRDKEGNLVSIGVTVPPHSPRKKVEPSIVEQVEEIEAAASSADEAQEQVVESLGAEVAEEIARIDEQPKPAPRRRRKPAAK